jgi:hypothetical protein
MGNVQQLSSNGGRGYGVAANGEEATALYMNSGGDQVTKQNITEVVYDEKHIVYDEKHIVYDKKHIVYDKKHIVYDKKHIVYDKKHIVYDKKHL